MGQVLGPHSSLFPFPAESPIFSLTIIFLGEEGPRISREDDKSQLIFSLGAASSAIQTRALRHYGT
jgi:hypothetical protein